MSDPQSSRASSDGAAAHRPFAWRRARLIARRELRERFAQRAFRVILLVGAALAFTGVVVPTLLQSDGGDSTETVEVAFPGLSPQQQVARSAALNVAARAVAGSGLRLEPTDEATARGRVARGDDDLALVILGPPTNPEVRVLQRQYASADAAQLSVVVERATLSARLDQAAPAARDRVLAPVTIRPMSIPSTGPSPAGAAVVGAMTLVLYLVGLLLITAFANGIVSDRAGRIIERLLTAARPEEHLAGKLVGVGAAGLLQIGAWIAAAGLGAVLVSSGLSDTFRGVPPLLIVWFPVSVVLTYVLYGAIAAVLVLPVRKIEDVGGAIGLASMLQIGSYIAASTIIAPGSTVGPTVHVLSLIPLFSPLVMLPRIAGGDVPAWELLVAGVGPLLLAAILIRLAAPAYARYAINAPGGKGLGAALKALRR